MARLFQRLQGKSMLGAGLLGISSMADPKGAAWSRNDKSHLYWRESASHVPERRSDACSIYDELGGQLVVAYSGHFRRKFTIPPD